MAIQSAFIVLAFLAAGEPAAAIPEDFPDADRVGTELGKPHLVYCDEFVCSYSGWFATRNVSCQAENADRVNCLFERTPGNPYPVPLLPGEELQPDTRVWAPAKGRFERIEGRWILIKIADGEA